MVKLWLNETGCEFILDPECYNCSIILNNLRGKRFYATARPGHRI